MKEAGVRPNVVTFTILIRSYCKNKNMSAAMSVLDVMRESGLRPDDRTYNTLIQGWIELKNMDRAMDLFKKMKRNKRVCPDVVTYNLLISGWARQMRNMKKAEKVKKKMEEANANPRDDINQALGVGMSGHHQGNVEVKYAGPDGVIIDVSETGWVGTRGLD